MTSVAYQALLWRLWVQVGLALCLPIWNRAWLSSLVMLGNWQFAGTWTDTRVERGKDAWQVSEDVCKSMVRWIEKAEWFHYFTDSSLPLHALHGILFIVLLCPPVLLYWNTAMIKTISKCTTGTPKSTSRIVSMRRYALTFRALAPKSSVDTIRALSLY